LSPLIVGCPEGATNHKGLLPSIAPNCVANKGLVAPSGQPTGKIMPHGRNIEETYKLLLYFFKSLNCLIGKPVILFTPDKVTIQLIYFLSIPPKKVIKLYSIYYINLIRKK
jgi:hypothetical protein